MTSLLARRIADAVGEGPVPDGPHRSGPGIGFAVAVGAAGAALLMLVAGSSRSPLSPSLPPGAGPLPPLQWLAEATGVSGSFSTVQGALALLAVLLLGWGFTVAAIEAWRREMSLRSVVWLAVGFHALVLLLPVLGSRDVFIYGLYGRIVAVHHANPFVVLPVDFSSDPLFRYVDRQWLGTPPVYGPAFLWLAGGTVRLLRDPAAMIFGFKAVAAAANLATLALVVRLVRRWRPQRATFAAVMVGLNPAVVLASVGGGHVDGLVGLGIVAALACLYPADPARTRSGGRELVATGILALCALVKFVAIIPMMLAVVVSVGRRPRGERGRTLASHIALAAAVGAAGYLPFFQTHDPSFGIGHLFPFGSLVAPLLFLNNTVVDAVGRVAGPDPSRFASILIRASAGLVFAGVLVVLGRHLVRRASRIDLVSEGAVWAWALLLASLSFQWLYPWYIIWFAPLVWLLPRAPRVTAILLSALLPLTTTAVDDGRAAAIARGIARLDFAVIAPLLLIVVVGLLFDLVRRVRRAELADGDRPLEPTEVSPRLA